MYNFWAQVLNTPVFALHILLNTINRPSFIYLNEPAHEIMALFVLRKLILQTRMRSHPVGLDI